MFNKQHSLKTVLVTPELPVQTGGIGTFVWSFAKLLRSADYDVHIIVTNPINKPRRDWIVPFNELGITVADVSASRIDVPVGYSWHKKVAEITAGLIPDDTDIVYLADWQAKGIDFVRSRRFKEGSLPVIVTVLHSCTEWIREGMKTLPFSEEELWLDFAEKYVAQYSDFVVSPGRYMLQWVRDNGWKLPSEERQRVLGYPFFPPRDWTSSQSRRALAGGRKTRHKTEKELVTTYKAGFMAASNGEYSTTAGKSLDTIYLNKLPLAPALANTPRYVPTFKRIVGTYLVVFARAGAPTFKRIVFFGRLETRKGIELFVGSLIQLKEEPCLQSVEEIVLLGGDHSTNKYGRANDIVRLLGAELGKRIMIKAITTLNTFEAQAYLAEHVNDTLVVVPSLRENFPHTVIEASLIPGLNLICSNTGSIPEVLGPEGSDQLFKPFIGPFTKKLEEALLIGLRPVEKLAKYDWEGANRRWLEFHEEVCAYAWQQRTAQDRQAVVSPAVHAKKSVDVCVSYYNLGAYLPFLLNSLARQTTQDFNVIVVNDGSTDPDSIKVFEQMSRKFQERGWRFLTTENGGLSAARNAGAAMGDAEYLIFVDADNVAAPNMVERFVQSIRRSGDDCLGCYLHLFQGEGWHHSFAAYPSSSYSFYTPNGNDPVSGIIDNSFGDTTCIVRRAAFDGIKGFTTDVSQYVTYEDYEFYTRLSLAGYKLDVMPEFLLYYRVRDGSMARTTDLYENKLRVLRVYEEQLEQVGLRGLASFAYGLYQRLEMINTSTQSTDCWNQGTGSVDIDVPYLVHRVSGHLIVKALRTKIRNQIVRCFGHPIISGN